MNIIVNTPQVFLKDLSRKIKDQKFRAFKTFDAQGNLDGYELKFEKLRETFSACLSDSKAKIVVSNYYSFGRRDSATPRSTFFYDIEKIQTAGLGMRQIKESQNKILA